MLKRIFVIGIFTGAGQLYSVFVLKFISQHCTSSQLNEIAQLDSLIFFIMNVIAFGLQSAAIRNLALAHDWKQEYYQTQSARIAMGMMLVIGSAPRMSPFWNITRVMTLSLVKAGHANGKYLTLQLPQIEAEGATNRGPIHID